MATVVGRVLRWAVILALIDLVLRAARKAAKARRAPEPAVEPAWPALAAKEPEATVVVKLDEPPAAMAPETAWVAADAEGACPPGYPIKVKERSGIYHAAGMLNYERTAPDRCYATEAAAEADGFRPAKR